MCRRSSNSHLHFSLRFNRWNAFSRKVVGRNRVTANSLASASRTSASSVLSGERRPMSCRPKHQRIATGSVTNPKARLNNLIGKRIAAAHVLATRGSAERFSLYKKARIASPAVLASPQRWTLSTNGSTASPRIAAESYIQDRKYRNRRLTIRVPQRLAANNRAGAEQRDRVYCDGYSAA